MNRNEIRPSGLTETGPERSGSRQTRTYSTSSGPMMYHFGSTGAAVTILRSAPGCLVSVVFGIGFFSSAPNVRE